MNDHIPFLRSLLTTGKMQAGGVLSKFTGLRRGKLFEKLRISTIETRLADFKCKMIVNDWAQPKTKRVVLHPDKLTPSNLGGSDCRVTSW